MGLRVAGGEEMTVEWRAEAGAAMNGGLGLAAIGAAGCKQTAGGSNKGAALIGKGVGF